MRRYLLQIAISLVFLVLTSCTGTAMNDVRESAANDTESSAEQASDQASVTDADVEESGINLLVSVQGTIRLKRREWSDYYRTDFGSLLEPGDLLQVQDDGSAVVLCDGLLTRIIPAGAPAGLNNVCPPPDEKILVRSGVFLGNTRGGNDPFVPYIISPRKTKVLTLTPIIRWNPVPGASTYTVSIKGEGVEWQATVSESSVTYPGEPSFVRGQSYAVIVQAETGESSQDEGVQGIGFTVVEAAAAARIEQNIVRIMELELDPYGKQLALGQYLAGEGLLSEAIEVLKELVVVVTDSPFPYRMLGDLYRRSGLNLLALDVYETALVIADDRENLEAGALLRAGLAEASLALGDREYAATLLREAVDLYQLLGDAEQVKAITESLEANGL